MQETTLTIRTNETIARDVWRMTLSGDLRAVTAPGQFVELSLPGFFLRRPISVCDVEGDTLTLIYKVVGGGTAAMARLMPGAKLDALTGLGNGYDADAAGDRPMLLGGGVGVPPLYLLARELMRRGKRATALLGFNTAEDAFYIDEFRALGCDVRVATADGSLGAKGFVTGLIDFTPTQYYACGPMPMLRAVHAALPCPGQLSFEERMGCGFGACMGCSILTRDGAKRVCKDGPVFRKEAILWT
ncbi:MAG: dihydroorotate dehydrogenase electron transfer subunit [Clostridiales bacterium]|nr:dihydroorotate dehydrogenase electron transfer subunit [Clostridiales bacterium]